MRVYPIIYSEVSDRQVNAHVKVWEDYIQHPVPDGCVIHHIDQDKTNNDILNLVCMTNSEHIRWHAKNRSKETLAKLSKSLMGHVFSDETKMKMSESKIGNKSCIGRKLSDETKKKISEANKGKSWTQERRNAQKEENKQ